MSSKTEIKFSIFEPLRPYFEMLCQERTSNLDYDICSKDLLKYIRQNISTIKKRPEGRSYFFTSYLP